MPNKTSNIPIALAIQSLRQELSQAIAEGDGKDLRFELGPVELEFQVEVAWEASGSAGAKAGINFGIVSLGEASAETEATRSKGKTHTIKLTLNPVASSGGDVLVSNADIPNPELID